MLERREEVKAKGINGNGFGMTLGMTVASVIVGWNSPQASDWEGNGFRTDGRAKLPGQARLTGWPTPMAGSPATETYNAAGNNDYSRKVSELAPGPTTSSSPAETASPAGSVLNAAMSRWLMGYPATWDEASPNFADWRNVQERIASGV